MDDISPLVLMVIDPVLLTLKQRDARNEFYCNQMFFRWQLLFVEYLTVRRNPMLSFKYLLGLADLFVVL